VALAAFLAGRGKELIHSLSLFVSVFDTAEDRTLLGIFASDDAQAAAKRSSHGRGVLEGDELSRMFALLRPNDLIWSYWVNNYLRGEPPKAFDNLYWNADNTRMTAGLHRDFIEIAVNNLLVTPGAASMLGTPVDLSKIDRDSYVIAGIADHLCAWQSCYQTTRLLGGESRFVLSTSGHIASLVNPPGNPKASFRVADSTPPDPARWLEAAGTEKGSWWPDHGAWLADRSGELVEAPPELGGRGLPAIMPAPGEYVMAT
jgi:poly(3-hydroxyalkanoate) synthetase